MRKIYKFKLFKDLYNSIDLAFRTRELLMEQMDLKGYPIKRTTYDRYIYWITGGDDSRKKKDKIIYENYNPSYTIKENVDLLRSKGILVKYKELCNSISKNNTNFISLGLSDKKLIMKFLKESICEPTNRSIDCMKKVQEVLIGLGSDEKYVSKLLENLFSKIESNTSNLSLSSELVDDDLINLIKINLNK